MNTTLTPSSERHIPWLRRLTDVHLPTRGDRRGWYRLLAMLTVAMMLIGVGVATHGPLLMAYVGVFGLSILTNAILFVPSGRGAVMVAGALILNPLAVAILSGIGGALGEMTGYVLGYSPRSLIKKGKIPAWLSRNAERNMPATLLVLSAFPNPFVDALSIIAGRMGYPIRSFLAYSMIGKVVQSFVVVYVALWNVSLVSSWIGLG